MTEDFVYSGLFGKIRQSVLALLYGQAGSSFYTRQVLDAVNSGRGAVQRELKNLTDAGIFLREVRGRQVYYRANEKCPIYHELRTIMKKVAFPPSLVREPGVSYVARGAVQGRVQIAVSKRRIAAFCRRNHILRLSLFGSIIRSDFRPDSDVDVLVEFAPGHAPGLFRLANMESELSALFDGHKVDLRTPADLSRYFRARVLAEAEVQYAAT